MSELQAINISAPEAYSIKELPPNWALISINDDSREELFPLQLDRTDKRILTVKFEDIITEEVRNGRLCHPLRQDLAGQIANFIEEYKNSNHLIHCHAGVSRSSAIALYIHLKYGHKLKDNFWLLSNPNSQALGMLVREGYRMGVLSF